MFVPSPGTPVPAPTSLAAPVLNVAPSAAPGAVTGGVRAVLRAEGLAALALATVLYAGTGREWGLFALFFLAPDLSFVAFLAGPRAGAVAYNALHTYVAPLTLILLTHAMSLPGLLPFGYVWAAHIGFDRLVGYGLKYASGFGDTHLGRKGQLRDTHR